MITIDPGGTSVPKLHSILQGAVAPRPIAFASTVDSAGNVNLSPFSFFNLFSIRPPILVFSPSRRGRDNTTKHTYQNLLEVPEVVISVVSFEMVEQTSLASVEFPKGVNEFTKSGLTPIASAKVKPPRVAESPAAFECSVQQIIPLGDQGGAGNLVVCKILLVHLREDVLDDRGHIDPQKIDLVARMGNDFYCRAFGDNIFAIPKPNDKLTIGFDQIPERIRRSHILTANDLGRLGNIEKLPDLESVRGFLKDPVVASARAEGEEALHHLAKQLLSSGQLEDAWKALLAGGVSL